jgi:hypothetical protein
VNQAERGFVTMDMETTIKYPEVSLWQHPTASQAPLYGPTTQARFPVSHEFSIPSQSRQDVFSVPSQQVDGAVPGLKQEADAYRTAGAYRKATANGTTRAYTNRPANMLRARLGVQHRFNPLAYRGGDTFEPLQQAQGGFAGYDAGGFQFGGEVPYNGQ